MSITVSMSVVLDEVRSVPSLRVVHQQSWGRAGVALRHCVLPMAHAYCALGSGLGDSLPTTANLPQGGQFTRRPRTRRVPPRPSTLCTWKGDWKGLVGGSDGRTQEAALRFSRGWG